MYLTDSIPLYHSTACWLIIRMPTCAYFPSCDKYLHFFSFVFILQMPKGSNFHVVSCVICHYSLLLPQGNVYVWWILVLMLHATQICWATFYLYLLQGLQCIRHSFKWNCVDVNVNVGGGQGFLHKAVEHAKMHFNNEHTLIHSYPPSHTYTNASDIIACKHNELTDTQT